MGRVIKVKLNHSKRKQALIEQNKQRTMFFRLVFAFALIVMIVAAVSFGPVWLIADATRMQQISAELKNDIADEFTVNQKLLIDEAVIKSNDRLLSVAKEDLGMVDPPAAKTHVSLDEEIMVEEISRFEKSEFWGRVASLTMSEASALLVGDVGISALR
ncbi:MAG: hypothetical protein FWE87_03985 [Coriobacteriia bacterium]|nr:hypothetical protein [Coriobacteriia bacterium]